MTTSNSISQTVSLDGNDEDSLMEALEARRTPQPDAEFFQNWEVENIHSLLNSIAKRDADVLRMRYGMDGHEPMTLQEIGDRINLSRERVRQIESEALKRLNYLLTKDAN
jgi:RNA polymerase primary sigma factor